MTAEDPPAGPLLCLTATELEVLEVAHLHGLAGHRPTPAQEGEDPGPAWMEAIASLTARGLLDARGRLNEGTAAGQAAQTMLDVRLAAGAVVVVERLVEAGGARRDLRLLHLLPLGAVVEDVHAEGLHGLDLVLDAGPLVEGTVAMLVPHGMDDDEAAGSPPRRLVEVDTADPEAASRMPALLGHPTVLAELSLVPASSPGSVGSPGSAGPPGSPASIGGSQPAITGHLLALGPAGCWAAVRAEGPLRFSRVPASWLRETLEAWVATVLEDLPDPG